jgi:hypothetical protein
VGDYKHNNINYIKKPEVKKGTYCAVVLYITYLHNSLQFLGTSGIMRTFLYASCFIKKILTVERLRESVTSLFHIQLT